MDMKRHIKGEILAAFSEAELHAQRESERRGFHAQLMFRRDGVYIDILDERRLIASEGFVAWEDLVVGDVESVLRDAIDGVISGFPLQH